MDQPTPILDPAHPGAAIFGAFAWATGIEDTFIPQVRPGLRALDEYELTQHYTQWKADFDLVAESGAKFVRWGIPWYRVQPGPDAWDWRWTDEALDYLVNVKGITPILDLMHYGTPLWLENSFINASYPQRVAEYAAQVCTRYAKLVRCYTPLNEPLVNAEFCGLRAAWPPYLEGEDGLVKVLLAVARGLALTTRALKREQPDCVTVQVEALWLTESSDPALQETAAFQNDRKFLSLDLTTGRVGDGCTLLPWLRRHGLGDTDLAWFADNAVQYDVLGVNFYPWSYNQLARRADGSVRRRNFHVDGHQLGRVLEEAYARYRMPMMVTETSAKGTVQVRERWMDETIDAVFGLRRAGLPLIGYTWFPLITMIDWAYRSGRRPLHDYLLHLGLYDSDFDAQGALVRHGTRLVERFRAYQEKMG